MNEKIASIIQPTTSFVSLIANSYNLQHSSCEDAVNELLIVTKLKLFNL